MDQIAERFTADAAFDAAEAWVTEAFAEPTTRRWHTVLEGHVDSLVAEQREAIAAAAREALTEAVQTWDTDTP